MYAPFVFCLGGRDFPLYNPVWQVVEPHMSELHYFSEPGIAWWGFIQIYTQTVQTGNERLEWYCAEITGLSGQFSW